MPGPRAHFFYATFSGLALNFLSDGAFGPHHILFYCVHAFFGPDIGVFGEFLFKDVLGYYPDGLNKLFMTWIHDPVGYMLCSLVLSLLYLGLSIGLVKWSWIRLYSKAPLTYIQCCLLGFAGGFSHFFLDNLFEQDSAVLKAVMATGDTNKQVYAFPILVLVVILICFFAVFFWIFRSGPARSQPSSPRQSPPPKSLFGQLWFLLASGSHLFHIFWMDHVDVPRTSVPHSMFESICARCKSWFPELWFLKTVVTSSIRKASVKMCIALCGIAGFYVWFLDFFKTRTGASGIGEEVDVGVVIFMATYFVVPHFMCILAMHHER